MNKKGEVGLAVATGIGALLGTAISASLASMGWHLGKRIWGFTRPGYAVPIKAQVKKGQYLPWVIGSLIGSFLGPLALSLGWYAGKRMFEKPGPKTLKIKKGIRKKILKRVKTLKKEKEEEI